MFYEIKYLHAAFAWQKQSAKGPYKLLLGKRAELLSGRTLLGRGRLGGQNHRFRLHRLGLPEALGPGKSLEQIGHDFVDMDDHLATS